MRCCVCSRCDTVGAGRICNDSVPVSWVFPPAPFQQIFSFARKLAFRQAVMRIDGLIKVGDGAPAPGPNAGASRCDASVPKADIRRAGVERIRCTIPCARAMKLSASPIDNRESTPAAMLSAARKSDGAFQVRPNFYRLTITYPKISSITREGNVL